jgi:hypothetical protein
MDRTAGLTSPRWSLGYVPTCSGCAYVMLQVIYPSTYEGQVAIATAQLLKYMQPKQPGPPHAEEA